MSSTIQGLFNRLCQLPFPSIGKRVGDFPLYDSMVAGCASRAAAGETISEAEIPVPDDDTAAYVATLREKKDPTEEEHAFLVYVALLERVCAALREHCRT